MEGFLEQEDKKILVIAPHADDEVLGAGGMLARAVKAGWEAKVLYATISGYSSDAREECSTDDRRMSEVKSALRILGVKTFDVMFRGNKFHLRLDTISQWELIKFIEVALVEFRPSLAVIPSCGHHHQDHRAIADACITALRPAPDARLPYIPVVLAYGHTAAGWGGNLFEFKPTIFVDISDNIETKIEALKAYKSQLCKFPHPRSIDTIRSWAAMCGSHAGTKYAEAFECLRWRI